MSASRLSNPEDSRRNTDPPWIVATDGLGSSSGSSLDCVIAKTHGFIRSGKAVAPTASVFAQNKLSAMDRADSSGALLFYRLSGFLLLEETSRVAVPRNAQSKQRTLVPGSISTVTV